MGPVPADGGFRDRLVSKDVVDLFRLLADNLEDGAWIDAQRTAALEGAPFTVTIEWRARTPLDFRYAPILRDGYGPHPFTGALGATVAAFAQRRRFFRWDDAKGRHAVDEPWDSKLTPWEIWDMAACLPSPPAMGSILARWYLEERTRTVTANDNGLWQELRGIRDTGDPCAYTPREPQRVNIFLGWPVYLASAGFEAGHEMPRCEECQAPIAPGRRICGSTQCARARDARRKRDARSYHRERAARETLRT